MDKQFVLVADRQKCIVGSIFPDGNNVEGVFTMNKGLVSNALDLVNHKIHLEQILLEVGKPVLAKYGDDLEGLNAYDPPETAANQDARDRSE